jgi:hypothetical protein
MLGLPYLQSSSLLHKYLIFILPGQGFGLFKLRNYHGNFFHLGVDKTKIIKTFSLLRLAIRLLGNI